MNQRARLEYIFHSNRLDGIAVSGEDTRRILMGEINPGQQVQGEDGKTYSAAVVFNHNHALDFIEAQTEEFAWSLEERHIREIHRRLMRNVILSNGEYRECLLRIQGLPPFPPEKILPHINEMCQWLNQGLGMENADKPKLAWRAHHELFYAHPFIEGNGRTARLLLNLIRRRAGLPLQVVNVQNHKPYIQGIIKYARQKAQQTQG